MKQRMAVVSLLISFITLAGYCLPAGSVLAAGPQSNLSLTLQGPNGPVYAGTKMEYSATVTNQGPAQAIGVQMALTLPPKTSLMEASPAADCGEANGVVRCNVATLDMNASRSFTLSVAVAPDARGSLLAAGQVSSNIADPDQNNNSRTVTTVVKEAIDLGVAIAQLNPTPAIAGAPLTYHLLVTNNGPSTASNTELELTLPVGRIERVRATAPGYVCDATTAVVSCGLGTVAPQGVTGNGWLTSGTVITVEVEPKATLRLTDTLFSVAEIGGDELESSTANNFAYRTIGVARETDLGVKITAVTPESEVTASHDQNSAAGTPQRAVAGVPYTYELEITNSGRSTGSNARLAFSLPPGKIERVLGISPSYDCDTSVAAINCALGTMAPVGVARDGWLQSGRVITVAVLPKVTLLLSDVLLAEASVHADEAESITPNNQATHTLGVDHWTDLAVAIDAGSTVEAVAGAPVLYNLLVTNTGPSIAQNVQLDVSLPPERIERVIATSPGYGCEATTAVVSCRMGGVVPPGVTEQGWVRSGTVITLEVLPKATLALTDSLLTDVSIKGDEQEKTTPNNSASQTLPIDRVTDLGVAIEVPTITEATAGAPFTYNVRVTNGGQSTGSNVQLELALPEKEIERVITTSPGYGCEATTALVRCLLGTVAPAGVAHPDWVMSGTVITVEVLPKTTLRSSDTLLAKATVDGDEREAHTQNNVAHQLIGVDYVTDLGVTLATVAPRGTSTRAVAGMPLVYEMMVTNGGHSSATNVALTLTLPPNQIERVLSSSPGYDCKATSERVTCALGSVAAGSADSDQQADLLQSGSVITVAVLPKATLLLSEHLLAVVEVDGDEPEGNTANNVAHGTTDVDHQSELALLIEGPGAEVQSGTLVSYTLTARNSGPSIGSDVVLTASFPADTFKVEEVEGAGCTLTGGNLSCRMGTLGVDQEQSVTLRGRLLALTSTTMEISGQVQASTKEATPPAASQSATEIVEVKPNVVHLPLVFR